ncbi:zinc finger protein 862-like [Rhizophagus clarus]|uniref:Zinc finger protein 862-like n=1 Tax=Rhizophagus clarus TaxID=94130 RepID=A0A8H3MDT5_9GLOM|nr:zinc finger protein 862-like [Rhizophagus clarus]
MDYNDERKLLFGENLNRFLLNVPLGENYTIAVISKIQERFPDRLLLNSMKILDHTNWPDKKEKLAKYVDCERGFSKQNLIKTDLRNSLNNETLHFWMMVGLEEKNLSEFNFNKAVQIWNNICKQRI